MKKLTGKVKEAYARQERVRAAKNKKVEELTIDEAKEIVKWERDKDRNHTILGLAVGAVSTGIWLSLMKDEQARISEFEKYRSEHTE